MKITPSDIVLWVGLALTILNVIDKSVSLRDRTIQPFREQSKRIDSLEHEVTEIKDSIKSDLNRIDDLEAGTKVLLRSIGALLSHGIEGNNEAEMRTAREELNEYLIQK